MDIHDAIAAWHDDPTDVGPLHEYLGMTWEQYKVWAETSVLPEGSPFADSGEGERFHDRIERECA